MHATFRPTPRLLRWGFGFMVSVLDRAGEYAASSLGRSVLDPTVALAILRRLFFHLCEGTPDRARRFC
jgi:hypothetical protein